MFLISNIHKGSRMAESARPASLVSRHFPTSLQIREHQKYIHQKSFSALDEFLKLSPATTPTPQKKTPKKKSSTIMYSTSNQSQSDHSKDSKDHSAAKYYQTRSCLLAKRDKTRIDSRRSPCRRLISLPRNQW